MFNKYKQVLILKDILNMHNSNRNSLVTKANNASTYSIKLDCSLFILIHKEAIWLSKKRQLVLFNVTTFF